MWVPLFRTQKKNYQRYCNISLVSFTVSLLAHPDVSYLLFNVALIQAWDTIWRSGDSHQVQGPSLMTQCICMCVWPTNYCIWLPTRLWTETPSHRPILTYGKLMTSKEFHLHTDVPGTQIEGQGEDHPNLVTCQICCGEASPS